MEDPNRSFDQLPDFGDVPPEFQEKKSTPTWVWIVGGVAVLGICCVAAVCGSFALLGDDIQTAFDEAVGTIESGGDFADFEATVESAVPQEDPVVEEVTSEEFNSADFTYFATFEDAGFWAEGDLLEADGTLEAQGYVTSGVFEFEAVAAEGLYWTTAGESFGDGVYEVEVTAVDGTINNGYGILFFYNEKDEENSDFYLFEISSDGFVWIGRCDNSCDEFEILVDEGWFESSAVLQGINVTNRLTVEVTGGSMRFLVNGIEVGTATDTALTSGDVGLLVESFDEGGVKIHFDNVSYQAP
ncbi:MAG: hypothetical protein QNJ45_23570 [Ardenticatenaceae bacterium]|nr:hypothetical protein [Ardenticatenaceae bacterium]